MDTLTLSNAEAIHVSTILEDCIDQLIILGRIMPVPFQQRPDAEQAVKDDISQLVESQQELESSFENNRRSVGAGDASRSEVQSVIPTDVKSSAAVFALALKQHPLSAENIEKVQSDRAFLEQVLHDTMMEIRQHGTFECLIDAICSEKEKKSNMEAVIRREEESRKRVRQLQKQITEVKHSLEMELHQRREMIAHLKDQLQEMKAKTSMEGKYVKKICDGSVAQTQKRCVMNERALHNEIADVKAKIDEENKVHSEIESFLRIHIEKRQELLQFWIDKHESDVEQKQRELDLLKSAKAKDLERLQELTRLYAEYEQVVVEDRIEKEKARRKVDQEAREIAAAIKCQSWWRGVMVRRCLGPYKKKKKKGGKAKEKK